MNSHCRINTGFNLGQSIAYDAPKILVSLDQEDSALGSYFVSQKPEVFKYATEN